MGEERKQKTRAFTFAWQKLSACLKQTQGNLEAAKERLETSISVMRLSGQEMSALRNLMDKTCLSPVLVLGKAEDAVKMPQSHTQLTRMWSQVQPPVHTAVYRQGLTRSIASDVAQLHKWGLENSIPANVQALLAQSPPVEAPSVLPKFGPGGGLQKRLLEIVAQLQLVAAGQAQLVFVHIASGGRLTTAARMPRQHRRFECRERNRR